MKHCYKLNIKAARAAGFEISNRQMTPGPVLYLSGVKEIADRLRDPVRLSQYAEVCLEGKKLGEQIYIKTSRLTSRPRLIIGYQPNLPLKSRFGPKP